MMLLMMMIMMNCFCGMVDRGKAFSLISSRDYVRDPHHRESPARHKQDLNLRGNLSSGFVERSCAVESSNT